MNVRERFIETLRGGKADRVPLMLDGFLFASRAEIDALTDPRQREIAHRLFDYCAAFENCPSEVNRYLVTPPQFMREKDRKERDGTVIVTTEIATPKGPLTAITSQNPLTRTTWTVKYPVESLDDVDRMLSVPWELPSGIAPPDRTKLPPGFHERCLVRTAISSPFVCAAGMMPYQYFLELCAVERALIRELTDVCAERVTRILDVLLAGDAIDYVWMGGCEWLTPPMASPRLYEELVQGYEAKIIERVHQSGAVCHVHCHGNVRSTLEMVIERGADFFEPVEPPPDGDISFAEAKALAAGRMTLGGNIEARLIENEDAEAVEAATRAAFEGGKERMVLKATEGLVREMTPRMLENYHRIIDVWEELSPLD